MDKRLLAISGIAPLLWPALVWAQNSTLFVLDGSGSMWGQVEGHPKIEIARQVMSDLIGRLPADVQAGLLVYGHDRKDDCNDIEVVAPLGSDRSAIVKALDTINPKGKTPITAALRQAVAQFRQNEGSSSVVVVSDGKETCGGDPCAAAREAISTGINLRIHVIGFDVTPEETEQLTCIAEEGHGKYFAASNADQLVTALAEVEKEVVAPPPPPPPPAEPEPTNEVLFEDHFERDELGDEWELKAPDPNRFAIMDGKALSVATTPEANIAVLRQPISGNFTATITATIKMDRNNSIRLYSWVGDDNYVVLRIDGNYEGASKVTPHFVKQLGGQANDINTYGTLGKVGDRDLNEAHGKSEIWYLQVERSGVKYTGRVSVNGVDWTEIGTHTLLAKGGVHLGFSAYSGGVENSAEFDDFVVTSAK